MINASCAFSRLKGRPVVLHILKTVSSKNQLTGLYSMRLFGLTDDQYKELKRRSKVAGAFPNAESLMRLAVSILIDINEEWITGRRYLSMVCE